MRWFQMRASSFEVHGKPAVVMSHVDITERIVAEEKLKQEKEAAEEANKVLALTQTALERTEIAELWVNADDLKIIKASDHAGHHFKLASDKLLTMSLGELLTQSQLEELQQRLEPIKDAGWGRFELSHLTKDDASIPVEITVAYRQAEYDKSDMFILFIVDITERKEAEIQLIHATEEAEAANRAKSVFLATMSHEIRTPLNGIVATIDLLTRTSLLPNQRDLITTAKESSLTLMGIIDDILDFSKIEAGKLDLLPVPSSLEQLIEAMGENLQPIARKKQVEMILYSDPKIPLVNVDPIRLRQILYNLTGNAIKFTSGLKERGGQVLVSAYLEQIEKERVRVSIHVLDNGIGMSEEVQSRLFQPFNQGEATTSRRFGGTGLGLVISRRLVEMMGGTIEMSSMEGVGTRFKIDLQCDLVKDNNIKQIRNLDELKVVLIESDPHATYVLKDYLSHAGADVRQVSKDDLIAKAKQIKHEQKEIIVILDSGGDLENSGKIQQQLRDELEDVELRFVVVGRGRRRYARAHHDDGMMIDLNAMRRATFINTVAVVAGRESPEQANNTQQDLIISPVLSEKEAYQQNRVVLVVDDNPTNLSVISQQLAVLGYKAQVAANGVEALKMWQKYPYPIILTDCHMPEMDGYELSETIRKQEKDIHTTIIAITADALKGTAEKCFNAGMDDYLTKPMQLNELQASLLKWSGEHGIKEITTKNETVDNKEEVIDISILKNLLGIDDPHQLFGFYKDFLDTSLVTVKQINDAIRSKDVTEIGKLAHKLKSSAKTVGAQSLATMCQLMEDAGKNEDIARIETLTDEFNQLYFNVERWIENYQAKMVCE
jgi:PAS domain S-box-containing protein